MMRRSDLTFAAASIGQGTPASARSSIPHIARWLASSAVIASCVVPRSSWAQAAPSAYTYGTRYDKVGRVAGTIAPDPDGSGPLRYLAMRTTYDAAGRVTSVEKGQLLDWQGDDILPANWTGFTVYSRVDTAYDVLDRKTVERASSGSTTFTTAHYGYNDLGLIECTAMRMNPAGFFSLPASACSLGGQGGYGPDRVTRNEYNAAGELTKIQKAYGTAVQVDEATYTYTANGKQATVKDANGNLARLTYDGFDHQDHWYFPDPANVGSTSASDYEQYGYDGNGNRTSLRKRDGRTITYAFDALNRITAKILPDGCAPIQAGACAPASATRDVYYGYDWRGLQLYARFDSPSGEGVTTSYDGFGEVVSQTLSMGGYSRALSSSWNVDGARTRLTHPDGVFVQYNQDGLDRLYYADLNAQTPLFYPPYDAAGRNPTLYRWSAGNWQANTSRGFDGIDRMTSASFNFVGGGGNVTHGFGYNASSQLVRIERSNDAYAFTHNVNVDRSYGVNGLNQYTTAGPATFSYDASGNLIGDGTRTYLYDAENRLVATGDGVTLAYDPAGRLWQATGPQMEVTQFLYDGDRLTAEYNGSGAMTRRYVHGLGDDVPLVQYDGAQVSSPRYLFADHQGSIVALADANGVETNINAYDEYGIPAPVNTGRFQYTGQAWLPELGMYYYKARIYSPTLGRFLQTDPVGYKDQVNLYAYVGNDPVSRADASGTDSYLVSRPTPYPGVGHMFVVVTNPKTGEVMAHYSFGPNGTTAQSLVAQTNLVSVSNFNENTNRQDVKAWNDMQSGHNSADRVRINASDASVMAAGDKVNAVTGTLAKPGSMRYVFWGTNSNAAAYAIADMAVKADGGRQGSQRIPGEQYHPGDGAYRQVEHAAEQAAAQRDSDRISSSCMVGTTGGCR